MRVIITKVSPIYTGTNKGVSVQWDMEAVKESGVFNFTLMRAGAPEGPWDDAATGADIFTANDYFELPAGFKANVLSLARDIYYKVKVIPPSGAANQVFSRPVNLDGQAQTVIEGPHPIIGYRANTDYQFEEEPQTGLAPRPDGVARLRLLRRKILREEYVLLKKLAGIEFALLKRRHFGTRCTSCYDPRTREVTQSACDVCYGTSWTDGYHNPVPMLGRRATSQINAEVTPQAKMETNLTRIQFLDFPRIDEEDIIVEKAHDQRYLVKSRYFTSLKTITVHQTVSVSELERQAVEYSIPVS
jgi:hypothetical protein